MRKRNEDYNSCIIIKIVFIVLFIVFIISSYNIIRWYIDSKNTKNIISDNNSTVEIKDNNTTKIINPPENKEDPYWDYIKINLIDVDFTSLKSKNSDTVGWIYVGGTNINYPIVQTNNNDYYLTHSFDKSKNNAGWVFMDYRNNHYNFNNNTIIYAHSRVNKVMFGTLKNILKSKWYDNTTNHIIKLSTEKENTLWQVFSVYKIPTTSDYLQTTFKSNNEYSLFINTLKQRSYFNFNTTVDTNDKILTLSTCYDNNSKVVMHSKLIKKSQK